MEAAFGAVGRLSKRMSDEWKAGAAEAGQALPEHEPQPTRLKKPGLGQTSLQWWHVLQVAPSATKEEIRQAYRRLIKENHPDKAAHLSPELQAAVERVAKRLNDAYERAISGK